MWLSLQGKIQAHKEAFMIKGVAFMVYPVTDMARARQFYEQDLGLTMSSSYEGVWIEYHLNTVQCFAITTMMKEIKPSATSGGSIGFEVDDVDATVKGLKAKGHKTTPKATHSPFIN